MSLPGPVLTVIKGIGLNAKTAGAVKIGTTENANRNFYVTEIILETTASSLITVPVVASIGTNGTSYNNISSAIVVGGLIANLLFTKTSVGGSAVPVIPPGTDVFINITIPAIGTSQTINVHVIGYYL